MKKAIVMLAALAASPAFAQWPSAPATPAARPAEQHPQAAPQRTAAPAEDRGSGFSLGARAAWAFPMGSLGTSQQLGDRASGGIPVWVEGGYRFNRNLFAGLYFQYGRLFSAGCTVGGDCSTSDTRAGIEATWSFTPAAAVSPWVGLGVGYEWFSTNRAGSETTWKGLELFNAQLGFDWNVNQALSIGPFAVLTYGKFSSVDSSGVSTDITDTAAHDWLQVGLKLTYRL